MPGKYVGRPIWGVEFEGWSTRAVKWEDWNYRRRVTVRGRHVVARLFTPADVTPADVTPAKLQAEDSGK